MANIIISKENISSFNRRTKKALSKILNQEVPLNVAEQVFAFALSSRDPYELKQLLEQKNGQFYEIENAGIDTIKKSSSVGFNFEEEAKSFLKLFEDFFKNRKGTTKLLNSIHFSSDGINYGLVFSINSKFSKKMSENGILIDFSSNSPAIILEEINENRLLNELNINNDVGIVIEHLKTWLKYQKDILDPGEFAFLMTRIGKICGFYDYVDISGMKGRERLYNYREKSAYLRYCLWKSDNESIEQESKLVGMNIVMLDDLLSATSKKKISKAREVLKEVYYLMDGTSYGDILKNNFDNFKKSPDGVNTFFVNTESIKKELNIEVYSSWEDACKKLTREKIIFHGYILESNDAYKLQSNFENLIGLLIYGMIDYSLTIEKNNIIHLKALNFKYEELFVGNNSEVRLSGAKAAMNLSQDDNQSYKIPFNPYGINEEEHNLWNDGYVGVQVKNIRM